MTTQEASAEGPSSAICELDLSAIAAAFPFGNFDACMLAEESEKEFQEIRKQLQRGFNSTMRNEVKRLKTFSQPGNCESGWAPAEMAEAGFHHTGVKTAIQCFCCGLVLLARSVKTSPYAAHKKHSPKCKFTLGEEVGNISKYEVRVQNLGKTSTDSKTQFKDAEVRLKSFTGWPFYAPETQPALLANAGFFFTGMKDTVQCFACNGCLGNWEEGDDPWKEHAKWFPECEFLQKEKTKEEIREYIQHYCGFVGTVGKHFASSIQKIFPSNTDEHEWLQGQLSRAYDDINFRKLFSFGDSNHFAIDLKLLYGDLAIFSKDISNLPVQQLTLPEVLESLHSITVIEGEAGSGKTALLRKIAILWASGCCPILSRFQLVFYLSLNSQGRDQSLADLICRQVVGLKGSLTEDSLKSICQRLKNQVLFLLDDYDEMNAIPRVIEELIQKNYLNKHCLFITVRTNRVGGIRHYAGTILSITEFPPSSTNYLLRMLFSHNIALLRDFFIKVAIQDVQSLFKTPLFAMALGAYWAQYPTGDTFIGIVILKAYLLYSSLKYQQESERLKSTLSSCGDLALRGLFRSQFEFSEEDLSEVGVKGEDALWFGLLSKFTAQRLRPLYTFFHLSFQEFLAGLRMSELLASDVQEDAERGLRYLQQINTFVKINGRYQYILRYACSEPSKAVPQIVSYLLSLLSCKKSFESPLENDAYLQKTPKLQLLQQTALLAAFQLQPKLYHSEFAKTVLILTAELAYQSNTVSACAPMLLHFLTGKEFPLGHFISQSSFIRRFFLDYPESLFLPSRFEACFVGQEEILDMSVFESAYSQLPVPVVDQEYAPGFTYLNDFTQQMKENVDLHNNWRAFSPRQLPDSQIAPFVHMKGHEKIPYLKCEVTHLHFFQDLDLQNLGVLFSVFDCIELRLKKCKGLIESIKPAIEQKLDSFKICSISDTDLTVLEENLLLSMTSLESLEIKGNMSIPETVFANLDKYMSLKELSLELPDNQIAFDLIPEGLKNLNMEKLLIYKVEFGSNSARLVELIQSFQNLSVFHLKYSDFSEVGALVNAMSSCKMLTEIQFTKFPFEDEGLISLAATLPNLTALRVLNLTRLNFISTEACTAFAEALGSLVNLEELVLPIGEGIGHAAKLIVQQCPRFLNLRRLVFAESLSEEGLLEIAKVATEGGFQKLEYLCLSANHNIAEESWRSFFQTLTNMPNLDFMDFSRILPHQIKCQAATVKSFVQCVSRLHNLKSISMIGWLFDEDDLKMFNVMKEQHPQSKHLSLTWQWMLPFLPIVNE